MATITSAFCYVRTHFAWPVIKHTGTSAFSDVTRSMACLHLSPARAVIYSNNTAVTSAASTAAVSTADHHYVITRSVTPLRGTKKVPRRYSRSAVSVVRHLRHSTAAAAAAVAKQSSDGAAGSSKQQCTNRKRGVAWRVRHVPRLYHCSYSSSNIDTRSHACSARPPGSPSCWLWQTATTAGITTFRPLPLLVLQHCTASDRHPQVRDVMAVELVTCLTPVTATV
jgi:hypothetical protein